MAKKYPGKATHINVKTGAEIEVLSFRDNGVGVNYYHYTVIKDGFKFGAYSKSEADFAKAYKPV